MILVAAALALGMGVQVKQVTGLDFNLFLTTDGSVYGIGRDEYGTLPRPNWVKSVIPQPTKITVLKPMVQVAVGSDVCYGLQKDGIVMAWGRNNRGQLGNGAESGDFVPNPDPAPVKDLTDIIQIDAASSNTVALRKDGKVFAWGDGALPRDGKRHRSATPIMIEPLPPIKKVDIGNAHTLALTADGKVYAWGRNSSGELGIGRVSESELDPTLVAGLPKVIDISAGTVESGCSAAVTADGKVYVWGTNTYAALGNGVRASGNNVPGGINPKPMLVKGVSGVKQVSVGTGHVAVLHTNGTVTTWGFDGYGMLGQGRAGTYGLSPQKVNLSGVKTVYAGGYRTFAIKNDGSVWWTGVNIPAKVGPMKDKQSRFVKLSW